MKIGKLRSLLLLHLLLIIYSISGVLSKLAAEEIVFSFKFFLFYVGVIVLLGVYAIGWQQIIKRMPLTTAFANKAVTVVWGIIWGVLFFHESLSSGKIIGALLVVVGVALFGSADGEETHG